MDKAEVARRQLGTALDLFLRGQDPVAIHTLAAAGGEVAETLAIHAGADPLIKQIRQNFPEMKMKEIRDLQRKYSNSFKHATTRDGQDREDQEILDRFRAEKNDDALFFGWHDLAQTRAPIPVEAQVFLAWYTAKYPERFKQGDHTSACLKRFPNLASMSPARQLKCLNDVIRKAKKKGAVMHAAATDRRTLVLPW